MQADANDDAGKRLPLAFDFSGVGLSVAGLPARLARRLTAEWAEWVAAPGARAALAVDVESVDRPYAEAEFRPKAMRAELRAQAARFEMAEGELEVDLTGAARVALVAGSGEREYFALLNLVRAGLAWVLPSRAGCVLHAAGLVLDGRAFVLVGPEGSGKTTWARLGQDAGAVAVSDDLVLLDATADGPVLLGAPFRSTLAGRAPRGRWPLAAVLLPAHGPSVACSPVPALVARARLLANLPFVATGIELDPRLARLVEGLVAAVPWAELRFGLEPGFVEVLRRWPRR